MAQNGDLSEREKQAAALLLQGKSNKEIALALGISDRTVEFHLKNIYAKLQVRSRTEAVLKLGKSTGVHPAVSTVVGTGETTDNDGNPIPSRRLPMKNLFYGIGGLLVITLVIVFVFAGLPARGAQAVPPPVASATLLPPTLTPTVALTPQPTISAKAHILDQIRQAVLEYEQNVQAEKKNGTVETSKDPQTGEDVFRFTGDSYATIKNLHEKLWDTINQLLVLYVQVYRDEARPTPFPTQASAAEYKAYYERLLTQGSDDCALAGQVTAARAATISIYSPDDGKYVATVVDDTYARCEVEGQMIEAFRTAPMLAKVNKDADMALIRQITGKPGLTLTFEAIDSPPNAVGRSAAAYKDETGTKYYVDVDTARLMQIEPGGLGHPNIPTSQAKSTDELRGVARQFAQTNSPRLSQLESVLSYQEGGKIDIYFFTWTYNSKDWSGTDWAMMPPFLQIGVLTNGQIYTYINSLDLYK